MSTKKNVTIISASPKLNEASVSDWLSDRAKGLFSDSNISIDQLSVRRSMLNNQTEQDFGHMHNSDALIFIFPLYIFCLPGLLMRYLQDYYTYFLSHQATKKKQSVFTVVNCGFPEADINEEAVRVIQSFSEKINASFHFGLMIGGGGMLLGAQGAPFMKKTMTIIDDALLQMKNDILKDCHFTTRNFVAKANFPRRLYYFAGDRGWLSSARKNSLKKSDLYATPYV